MKITDLLGVIEDELNTEKEKSMTPEERIYHGVAQKLLLLERDLCAPGATRSSDERVDRILEAIAKENF